MDKIIDTRMDTKGIGFNAELGNKREQNVGKVLKNALPQDFVKFGMIPELMGRIPVVVSLDALDKETLVRILQEPKNSIVKQYKKLFELDGVDLQFEEDAIEAIASKSLERKTGARGLRAIMEKSMMDIMYTVPSDETIETCVITKETIDGEGEPKLSHCEKLPIRSKGRKTSRTVEETA